MRPGQGGPKFGGQGSGFGMSGGALPGPPGGGPQQQHHHHGMGNKFEVSPGESDRKRHARDGSMDGYGGKRMR